MSFVKGPSSGNVQSELNQILAMPDTSFMRAAYHKASSGRTLDPEEAVKRVKRTTEHFILDRRNLIPQAEWKNPNAYTPPDTWTIRGMQEMVSQILTRRSQNALTFFDFAMKHLKLDRKIEEKVASLPTPREKAQAIHSWAKELLPTLSPDPPAGSPLQFSPLAQFLGVACKTNALDVAQIIIDSPHFRQITRFNLDLLVAPLVMEKKIAAAKLFFNSSRFREIGIGSLGMMLVLATEEDDPIVEQLLCKEAFLVFPGPPLFEIESALQIAKKKNSRFMDSIQALYDLVRLNKNS